MEFELSEIPVEAVVKPKRKYVRKKPLGNEPLTKEMFESIKSNLKRKVQMMLTMTSYRSGSAASKWIEAYIDNILKYINGNDKLKSHVSNLHDKAHYASYRIIIFDYNEDTTRGYNATHMSFKMEELHSNCSSIGIHHFDGQIVPDNSMYSNNKPAFDSIDKFKMFLVEIEELAEVFGYSNILYTTSNESIKCFREYVEATSTKIDSFTNKRSQRVINYYSKRI
jgi:hypothetical protein